MAITLKLPADVERRLAQEWPDLPRKALEALVVEGYRQEILSRGQVGEILGLDRWAVEAFLGERGVFRLYDVDDLDRDLEANRRLLNASKE